MVLFRHNTDPKKNQAKLNIRLSTPLTLSIGDPNAVLRLAVAVSIASTKDEERRQTPLTLCTESGVLEKVERDQGGIDIFARSGFTLLRSTGSGGDRSKSISLGHFCLQRHSDGEVEDMWELQYGFLTVPLAGQGSPDGQQDGKAATTAITHELEWKRIFKCEEKRTKTWCRMSSSRFRWPRGLSAPIGGVEAISMGI